VEFSSSRPKITSLPALNAVFVRNIDVALQRAEASYSREVWQMMTASERSAAIYRELRALDAQAVRDGSLMVPPRSDTQ